MLLRISPIPRHARVTGQGKGQFLFTGLGRLVRIRNTSKRNKIPAISRKTLAAVFTLISPNLTLAGVNVGAIVEQRIYSCQSTNE